MTQKELVNYISKINGLLALNRFDEVNDLLKNLDVAKVDVEEMIALLRTTYAARTLLRHWYLCGSRVAHELTFRGLNATQLLKGLGT